MSWPQPTAQYGQTPWATFASLMRSEVAAAATGARSTPVPTATPAALAVPILRKSRRERLMESPSVAPALAAGTGRSRWALELGARQLVPDAADHEDALGTLRPGLEADDVAGMQRLEAARRAFGGLDERLPAPHPHRLVARAV